MLAGYITEDGDVLTPIIPAGSKVWVRARGEVFGRLPSAYTDVETITLSQTPGLAIVQLTLVENESAGCTPFLSWTPNAYAEGLRIRTSVGAFGHTPSYTTWDDVDSDTPTSITLTDIALDSGEEIYVEITAYPTFSGGSVSGSPGSQYVLRESCEVEDEPGGASDFLSLNDTPNSYDGQGGNLVAVEGAEGGLEFISPLALPAHGAALTASSPGNSGSADSVVAFDAAVFDTDGYWDNGSPNRLTIPTGLGGLYQINAASRVTLTTSNTRLYAQVRKNGSTAIGPQIYNPKPGTESFQIGVMVSVLRPLDEDEYIELLDNNSAGTLARVGSGCSLELFRVGNYDFS